MRFALFLEVWAFCWCGGWVAASRVKLADLDDDLDPSLPVITALKVHYRRALAALAEP